MSVVRASLTKGGLSGAIVLAGCVLVSGCGGPHMADQLPAGPAAYKIAPPLTASASTSDYLIGAGDELSLQVFDEPDITNPKLLVDQSGRVSVALAGTVSVAGKSASEAAALIRDRLSRMLRHPDVTVNISAIADRYVSVEGDVVKPGVYQMNPNTTLLSALALAQSPTRIARLDNVVILRNLRGDREAARFDIRRIRAGLDPDPLIVNGDIVVVSFDLSKSFYRDILTTAPLLGVFTRF